MDTLSLCLLLTVPMLFAMTQDTAAEEVKDLRTVYDAYNSAAKKGDVDAMLTLRTAETAEEIREQLKSKEDRDYFILLGKGQVPETYDVQHVNWSSDGGRADLYALWHLPPMKEIQRSKKAQMEVRIDFQKDGGAWKMGTIYPLGDPSKVQRPKDLSYHEKDADTGVTAASVAGRIVKLEFKPDHTLVLLRVLDEEIAVFLPPKQVLENAGVEFDALGPWKMREFTGFPHRADKLRFFATGDRPVE